MTAPDASQFHIWLTLALVVAAIVLYSLDVVSMETVSVGILAVLLVTFTIFPLLDAEGRNLLTPEEILKGFASPALFAVLALVVMGQAMVQTGALERFAQHIFQLRPHQPLLAISLTLMVVAALSGFLNNTPVVVIFIPIMQALSQRFGMSPSAVMMPLSFAAIFGGMTTLIGSSTNLLTSSAFEALGFQGLPFFSFTVPGLVMAAVGFLYLTFVAHEILPQRSSFAAGLVAGSDRPFLAQITVRTDSQLVDAKVDNGGVPSLKGMTIRTVLRGEHAIAPTYHDVTLQAGDILLVTATREALTNALAGGAGVVGEHHAVSSSAPDAPAENDSEPHMLAEIMVTPASRLIGYNLERIGFRYRYKSIVLGLQRRARTIGARMSEIPLEAGDILLVQGGRKDIRALGASRDMLPIEHSATELPSPQFAPRAAFIFFTAIALAALELLPVVTAAIGGAAALLFTGVLNPRQAARAIDRRLFLLVGASLALGTALHKTGAAAWLAHLIVQGFHWAGPVGLLSVFFLFVAIITNIISNNACAIIFTPVAVNIAQSIGVDPTIFVIGVLLAANCSFMTPLGYQTNLLVMGPGHYRFSDFVHVGLPLTVLMWLTFTLFVPAYYGM